LPAREISDNRSNGSAIAVIFLVKRIVLSVNANIKPILLAEDFEDDATIIQHVLKKAGVINPIIVVTDGAETLAYLKGEGFYADRTKFPLPSVLLLDLKMPKRNGFEVMEWCKTQPQLKDMLVVILSGHQDLGAINRAYSLGAHSFLLKPCTVEDITNLTENFRGYWTQPSP
jgi:CheY-like chemotaxis protein